LCLLSLGFLGACGSNPEDTGLVESIDSYEFTSVLTGESSVARSGQVFRHLLIDEIDGYLGDLTERIDSGDYFPESGDITADLNFYFEFNSETSGDVGHGLSNSLGTVQTTYSEISSGADLVGKLAGNDASGQHQDWSSALIGWESTEPLSPEELVRSWFSNIDDMAVARANGELTIGPDGEPVMAVYLTGYGTDLRQLLTKFLNGAVAYSQATDDCLDDDIAGEGLNSDHSVAGDGKAYTALEHVWDEAFGYFGAATDYALWTDDEIAHTTSMDRDGDGLVDLIHEVNWGHSVNAAKRDLGASDAAPTDFTKQAWDSFTMGRSLLAETAGQPLTEGQVEQLQLYRDGAVTAWESSISATVVHYINALIVDLSDGAPTADVAKHFSELKGFSLTLQFNPRSMILPDDFADLQALIGQAPYELGANEYTANLIGARDIVVAAYGFSSANAGDEYGEGGW